jgi:hypothetical protein
VMYSGGGGSIIVGGRCGADQSMGLIFMASSDASSCEDC